MSILRFASLGSGSEGNALIVESGTTRVMLDCGFSVKETARRLARLNLTPEDLTAVVVTHEHADHIGSAVKFCARYQKPLWGSYGTFAAWLGSDPARHSQFHQAPKYCHAGQLLEIGELQLQPYTVPHDAREPLQFVFANGQHRLGVLTDAGHYTRHLAEQLHGVHALVLECNHDVDMLVNSNYPASLKHRIGGLYGHLSNQAAEEVLNAIDQSCLQHVVAAHLSRQNNSVELVRATLDRALKQVTMTQVAVACQDEGFDWLALA